MNKTTLQFDLYSLLLAVANEESPLIGIKLIKEEHYYFIGLSWLVHGELHFRSFNQLTLVLLKQLYLPKVIAISPQWQQQLNCWLEKPTNILSLGKLAFTGN